MIIVKYFLWLILYSVFGWIYESAVCSVSAGYFINRGFLTGPLCPVYGFGALAVIIFLYKRVNNVPGLFFAGMALCTVVEYITAVLLENLFHAKWWDYSGQRFNFQGRVCLLGAVVFASLSVLLIKVIHPFIERMTSKIPDTTLIALAVVIFLLVAADLTATVWHLLDMNKRLAEIQTAINSHMEASRVRTANLRSGIAEKFEESPFYNERIHLLLGAGGLQSKRLIKAFPKMRSIKYGDAWEKLKEKITAGKENLKKR